MSQQNDIMKWIEEVERIYKELIEKSKYEISSKLSVLKQEQQDSLKKIIEEKQNFVNNVIRNLSKELEEESSDFESVIKEKITDLETSYNSIKSELINQIINDLEIDF